MRMYLTYAGVLEVDMSLPKWFRILILALACAGVATFADELMQYPSAPFAKSLTHDAIIFVFGSLVGKITRA